MELIEILEQWTQAYPEDIFRPITQEERDMLMRDHPGLIDRISAAAARHVVEKGIKPAIAEIKSLAKDKERIDLLEE